MLNLNDEQLAAVQYLDGPLLVLAGPGTGKTQLLSAKVAYILEHTDANPSNILCLTFTEAGATNMRDRLRSMIGQAAGEVTISTYHAFGKNLLDRYQNYAENPERLLTAPIDETTQHKIVADLQKTLPARDVLRKIATSDLVKLISETKAARLTADDLEKIYTQNLADSTAIADAVSDLLADAPKGLRYGPAVEQIYQPLLEILSRHISPDPIAGNIERLANALARELHQILAQLAAAEKPSVSSLSAWRDQVFERRDDGGYRLKDHLANLRLHSLAELSRKYAEHLEAKGLFDFNDMIELAIHYLKTDTGFRLSLSERFQYVLLDEFQDTNTSQFELIKLLTDYERPTVMAVGDDDQAIYAFQGANASNLLEFREHYHAKVITLLKNYRSLGDILTMSRGIADQIGDSFVKSYEEVNKTLTATRGDGTAPTISRHEFPCPEAEYYWVADQVDRLLQNGVDPTEIAVIAPKHKYLVAILPYLKARDINIAYEKRENLLEDENLQMIFTLARFIHELATGKNPSHRLLEILSYEFWELPVADVVNLFSERRSDKTAIELLKSNPATAPLADFFAELVAKSLNTPLELWLDYLTGAVPLQNYTSPFLSYYKTHLAPNQLLEFYESLATLRETLLAHATSLGDPLTAPRLADLIATLDDYTDAGTAIMRISAYRDSLSAVQVMTAHKSKGLEFQHVFLIAVDDRAWGGEKGNNDWAVLPRNLTPIHHTGKTADEQLRLLFVALTRAKDTLTLSNAKQDSAGKHHSRLGFLNESSLEADDPISPLLPASAQAINRHDDELTDEQKIAALRLGWLSHYQKFAPELHALFASRVADYRLTASDLTSFIDLAYAGPQAIYSSVILHEPAPPTTQQQAYGSLVHKVFEQVTKTGCSDEEALSFFEQAVPATRLSAEDQAELLEAGRHNLSVALRAFAPILRHPHARSEVNFSAEHLCLGDIPLTGKTDLLILDPEQKTLTVYDYKTGKYYKDGWDSKVGLYKYRLQLGFYKLLLNLSPTYRNYKVTEGHILFVTPDNDDKVYDRPYTYNEAHEAELKKLIASVYREITSLDFISDPELFLPPDPNLTAPRLREFVAKLIAKLDDPRINPLQSL